MALNLGGVIRLTYAVKNDLGVLTNPGAATLAITQPDGTVAAGTTVTLPPAVTGQLVVDFAPSQAGLHSVHWSTTNPITSEDDVFFAERPAAMLVSVDEAVEYLNASGILNTDQHRERLQRLCIVATDSVERELERVFVRRTVAETYDGDRGAIILRSTPIIDITSVVESGTTLSSGYLLNRSQNALLRGTTTSRLWWASGDQNIVVTYVAGYVNPPAVVRETALARVQSMWQMSQQAAHPFLDESSPEAFASIPVAGLSEIPGYGSIRRPGVA